MLFDCLRLGRTDYADRPLSERRQALEQFHARAARPGLLTPVDFPMPVASDGLA